MIKKSNSKTLSQLEKETEYYLQRSKQRAISCRRSEYHPTLEVFSNIPFSDYVREVLMGVPVRNTNYSTIFDPSYLHSKDGIAKIKPPNGWWDKSSIDKDSTGREASCWNNGKIGNMIIPIPIKQFVTGIGGIYEFSMVELPPITVSQFRKNADDYRKRHLGKVLDEDMSDDYLDDLARKFWKRLGPTMEPSIYGADVEGSLFGENKACGWNIDKLDNCLQLLKADYDDKICCFRNLPGVMNAYLYFGMWASSFAAHNEDMNLLSINYLHAGAPKYWYAINSEDSNRFESLMVSHFSEDAKNCPAFLRHKSYLLSPHILTRTGIRFTTQIQRVNDIIITFPGIYHFGFNTGFNVAESTNFAVPEWVPMGEKAQVCMCHPHSVRIDMNRFKHLLSKFLLDQNNKHLNLPNDENSSIEELPFSYLVWAREEILRKKKSIASNNKISTFSVMSYTKCNNILKPLNPTGIIVKIISLRKKGKKETSYDISFSSEYKNEQKKKILRKEKISKHDMEEVLHVALRVKSSKLVSKVPIIYQISSSNDNGKENIYCKGIITSVVDGYARIHFSGVMKKYDMWVSTRSDRLYLDMGKHER